MGQSSAAFSTMICRVNLPIFMICSRINAAILLSELNGRPIDILVYLNA
jgi:hypothetical protein